MKTRIKPGLEVFMCPQCRELRFIAEPHECTTVEYRCNHCGAEHNLFQLRTIEEKRAKR